MEYVKTQQFKILENSYNLNKGNEAKTAAEKQLKSKNSDFKEFKLSLSSYLLHCWQNRCSWPLMKTLGVLEWISQTLCRRW